jgi:hydroxymethylpyrimidine/phosphomethylpyrimidine kinase
MIPRVLVIAGSDSGGGAGIQADIKTVMALGGYAVTAITAITAQNTVGIAAIEVLSPALVIAQIDAVLGDIGADAIKIGMIGSAAIAEAVADRLALPDARVPVVFDPVMAASSGARLSDPPTTAAFAMLMRRATIVTPNVAELAALAGGDAAALAARTGAAVLAKGGDADGAEVVDRLFVPRGTPRMWRGPRIGTGSPHGTGCTLASAIATRLAAGDPLAIAVDAARRYVRAAIAAAPGLGSGASPPGHRIIV